jgi:penicillin-binding protein 1A
VKRGIAGMIRILAYLFGAAMLMLAAVVVTAMIYLADIAKDLPDHAELKSYSPPVMTRVHAGDGTLIAEYAREHRIFVPLDAIPQHVIDAFLSAEDRNFYNHIGIDLQGVARAAIANVQNVMAGRRLEGASTITQQVTKNFFLTSEVSMERKIKEALLAFRLEESLTKDEILELYLNEIYLGWRAYGVASAALQYFDKALNELTVAEAAYLAAMPKAPNNYRPDLPQTRERGLARRNWVLERMAINGFISQEVAQAAREEQLIVHRRPTGAHTVEAEYFVEEVRREIVSVFGNDALYDGGLSVRATLDTRLQEAALRALRNGLVEFDRRLGWRGPFARIDLAETGDWASALTGMTIPRDMDPWRAAVALEVDDNNGVVRIGFAEGDTGVLPLAEMTWARATIEGQRGAVGPRVTRPGDVLSAGDVIFVEPVTDEGGGQHWALRQIPEVNGALVAMDPHTGRVLAMIGGFSFQASEFNRATQARRQSGSAFKPFVYAAAFDQGYTPSSLVLDAPFVMEQGPGLPLWKPENYTQRYYGVSTLRRGMEASRNLMTVRLARDVGMEHIVDYARRMGVVDNMPPLLAMSLGAAETTLMRMTAGYSIFVNGGKRVTPTLIDRVQDRYGRTIYRHDKRPCEGCLAERWEWQEEPALPDMREEVLDPRTSYQIVSLLEGVVQRGTATSVRAVGKPLAGKTGTTNEARDAWFIGFAPDLAVGVYIGYDTPRPLGVRETGGSIAAPIFRDFMSVALADQPAIPFRTPPGVRLVRVNAETGVLARDGDRAVIIEAFKPGTEPDERQREVIGGGVPGDWEDERVQEGTGGLY